MVKYCCWIRGRHFSSRHKSKVVSYSRRGPRLIGLFIVHSQMNHSLCDLLITLIFLG